MNPRRINRRTQCVVALVILSLGPLQFTRSDDPNPRSLSERRSLGAIFDDMHVQGSVLAVRARAATMPLAAPVMMDVLFSSSIVGSVRLNEVAKL